MILLELEIEDYKQFAGLHRFTPPTEGAVAIIGQNGAGKTTLFEAVEWCLYQPREIAADEVPPRGKVAKPRVKITLLDPRTNNRYVVERTLNKSKVADAEIYREDAPESRIVKGSRSVTEHVSRSLIGLSHRAFVSTFFTRQKELFFFGDLKETDRRREVGRLLGMETIRDAQRLIGDDRTAAQNQARALQIQSDEASAGRDFAQEIAGAEQVVAERGAAMEQATIELAAAAQAHAAARVECERLTALERDVNALRATIERSEGDLRAEQARRDAALALGRIDAAAAERPTLHAQALQLEPLRIELVAHEAARERHVEALQLRQQLAQARRALEKAAQDLESAVVAAVAPGVDGWRWRAEDRADPATSARRLIDVAGAIDLGEAEARANDYLRIEKFGQNLNEARAQAANFRKLLDALIRDRDGLLADGDPHALQETTQREREAALRAGEQAAARIRQIDEQVTELRSVVDRLSAQEATAACPTCARPFVGNEFEITRGLFASKIEALHSERVTHASEQASYAKRIRDLDTELSRLSERAREIDTLSGRIQTGEQRTAEAEQGVVDLVSALENYLSSLGLTKMPPGDEIDRVKQEYETSRRVTGTVPLLVRVEADARQSNADEISFQAAHAKLGDVAYDNAAHDQVRAALRVADGAAAKVEQIDAQLALRPGRQDEANAAEAANVRLTLQRDEQLRAVVALGYDPEQLKHAREHEHATIETEREARDARAAAEAEHVKATAARDALVDERARIERLAQRAVTVAREADDLDLMYREFNAFEQFVADRLTPQLSEYTSELLEAITEGKYDHVWFNSNYGLEVYDSDEKFPVEEFSGGERDVIALSARLALSRLIGSQANNPPGFMVLDEIFGSLDRERRLQVLETLGALAGTADAYHQLFIISHVDDVRASPIFNEVWRVTEGPDGTSRLENLNSTGGFEEM